MQYVNPYVLQPQPPPRDKRCTVYVHWTPDGERSRTYYTRAPVTVEFADGEDLLQQLDRISPPERWRTVHASAPDMGNRAYLGAYRNDRFFTDEETVYGMTGVFTLALFPRTIDGYCNSWVRFVRSLLTEPQRSVRVEIRLDVTEREQRHWGLCYRDRHYRQVETVEPTASDSESD